ncbi:MAG: hydrogenase maturation protease [Syntrophobacteraceae bacterium]
MENVSGFEKRIGIIGLGNVLMSDDAFGPYVIQVLDAGYVFPGNVVLLDLGTPSLDLFGYLEDLDFAIIIDCVSSKGRTGELHLYDRKEILKNPIHQRTNPHEPGLKEALLLGDFYDRGPKRVLLVGVIPESTSTNVGLTAPVMEAVPQAVGAVLGELEKVGVEVQPRSVPVQPGIWWEQTSSFSDGKHPQPGMPGDS